jgi:hypothetical protein
MTCTTKKEKSQTVRCPLLSCHEKVHINKVMDHIQEKNHTVTRINNGQGMFISMKPEIFRQPIFQQPIFPHHIEFENRDFFFEMTRDQSGTWKSWVYFSGLMDEAAKYNATIKLYSYDEKRSLTYVGDVMPMDCEGVKNSIWGTGFAMEVDIEKQLICHDTIVKSFISVGKNLYFCCTITKLGSPLKAPTAPNERLPPSSNMLDIQTDLNTTNLY